MTAANAGEGTRLDTGTLLAYGGPAIALQVMGEVIPKALQQALFFVDERVDRVSFVIRIFVLVGLLAGEHLVRCLEPGHQ